MGENKRFDDWEQVDCNDCSHYWDSSCDGASKGSRVGCNSFLATRSIVIPEKVNKLEKRVKSLEWHLITIYGVTIIWTIAYMMGWL